MFWHDLKQAINAQNPSNLAELQQLGKEEWGKIHPEQLEGLIVMTKT